MKIKDGYILKTVADSNVIVPVCDPNFKAIMTVNDTGAFLFEKLKEQISLEQLALALAQEYEIDELIAKNELLRDFKAVKNGNVWCTRENLYQETMKLGTVISDFNSIFTDNTKVKPTQFLYRLESGESVD
jgi:iron complex transport system substrate-binding protein